MKRLLSALFCLLLIGSCLLIGRATPPLLSADEHAHLIRAYTLVSPEWIMHAPPGQSSSAWVDPSLAHFIHLHRQRNRVFARRSSGPVPTQAALQASGQLQLDKAAPAVEIPAPGAAVYPPLAYLPQGLALGVAQALHWPVEIAYGFARLMGLLCSAAALFIAFRLITPSPLQLALLSLPMSLFQLASASLDGFSNSIAVLAISLHMAAGTATTKRLRSLHIGLLVCLIFSVPARLHLWPLLAMPFLSARRLKERWAWLSNGCLMTAVGLWVLHVSRSTVDLRRADLSSDVLHTTGQLITHPVELISLLVRTLTNQELLSFYGRSFIGVLGWLHLPLKPPMSYLLMTLLLGLCTLLSLLWAYREPRRLLEPSRLLLVGLAFVSGLSVFLLLLLGWTPNPTRALVIEGVQGRYFLLPALLMTFALAPPQERLQRLPILALSYGTGAVMLGISTVLTLQVL